MLPLLGRFMQRQQKLELVVQGEDITRKLLETELHRLVCRSWNGDSDSGRQKAVTDALMALYDVVQNDLEFIHLLEMTQFFHKKENRGVQDESLASAR